MSQCYGDVLTLGQQQFSVLHYQVQQKSVALSCNSLQEYNNPTLEAALIQAKKDVNTPELAQPIQCECPFTLGHNL